MKQVVSNKYNVAWFKLADCVSRGEKERALGVYRLLAHSLDDQALARQLEGDLLLAFQDERALDKYRQAISLYKQDDRILEAAAVYEHLITLNPKTHEHLLDLIDLYKQLRITSKVHEHCHRLFKDALEKKQWDKAQECAGEYDKLGDWDAAALIHEQLAFAMLEESDASQDLAMSEVQKVINAWLRTGDQQKLQQFLSKLKLIDEVVYALACEQMNEE